MKLIRIAADNASSSWVRVIDHNTTPTTYPMAITAMSISAASVRTGNWAIATSRTDGVPGDHRRGLPHHTDTRYRLRFARWMSMRS